MSDLIDPPYPPWYVEYTGGRYKIYYDTKRKDLQPKWRILRVNDMAFSKRWYSWPEGAFSALSWGRIEWTKQ